MTDHDTELAREITEKGLEEYSSSWKKANKKGDAGRPFRECMSEAITQALRSVRQDENEGCAKVLEDFPNHNTAHEKRDKAGSGKCGLCEIATAIRNRLKSQEQREGEV